MPTWHQIGNHQLRHDPNTLERRAMIHLEGHMHNKSSCSKDKMHQAARHMRQPSMIANIKQRKAHNRAEGLGPNYGAPSSVQVEQSRIWLAGAGGGVWSHETGCRTWQSRHYNRTSDTEERTSGKDILTTPLYTCHTQERRDDTATNPNPDLDTHTHTHINN